MMEEAYKEHVFIVGMLQTELVIVHHSRVEGADWSGIEC